MYLIEQWQAVRWQSPTRYYTAEIIQDLFGCWLLRLSWGGLHNRKGNFRETTLKTRDEALRELEKVHHRRQQRGYQRMGDEA